MVKNISQAMTKVLGGVGAYGDTPVLWRSQRATKVFTLTSYLLCYGAICAMTPGISSSSERSDWTLQIDPERMTKLPSQWQEYFGIHYKTADANSRQWWKTVRGYGGPHVGLPEEGVPTGEGEPVRVGPFTGREVRVGLRDIRRHRGASTRSIDLLAPEIIREDLTALYLMTGLIHPSTDPFDKDLSYWALRLLYDRFPEADKHIYWQMGNEVNGLHFDPTGLKEKIKITGESRWKYFNTKEQQELYVEGFLAPAVETVYRASQDVYGDPHRIKILSGSVANTYNPKSVQWLCEVMDHTIAGSQASSLIGDPVWKHIDILTVHYPFARPNGAQVVQEIQDRYLKTGKVEGVWITEEHGNQGKGPVTITDRSLRFIYWAAENHLSAEQTRLVWWGTHAEKPGGRPIEAVELLGRLLAYSSLRVSREMRSDAVVYTLIREVDEVIDGITLAILPTEASEPSVPGSARVRVPKLRNLELLLPESVSPEAWTAQAFQFSTTEPPVKFTPGFSWDVRKLVVSVNRNVAGPLLLSLTPR